MRIIFPFLVLAAPFPCLAQPGSPAFDYAYKSSSLLPSANLDGGLPGVSVITLTVTGPDLLPSKCFLFTFDIHDREGLPLATLSDGPRDSKKLQEAASESSANRWWQVSAPVSGEICLKPNGKEFVVRFENLIFNERDKRDPQDGEDRRSVWFVNCGVKDSGCSEMLVSNPEGAPATIDATKHYGSRAGTGFVTRVPHRADN